MSKTKRIEIVKKAEALILRIDGEEIDVSSKDNAQLQLIDVIDTDSGYKITVFDSKIAQLLTSHAVAQFPPLNRLRLQCDFEWSAALDWLVHYVQISPTAGSSTFSIEFAFFPGIKDSAKSYVFTDYYWALEQTRRATKNATLSLKLKSNSDGLTDGFRAEFSCSSVSSPIRTQIEECVTTLIQLHEQAKTITSLRRYDDTIRVRFDFPEEISAICSQYLLYFVEFLRELGVKTTSELFGGPAGQILFTVKPQDKQVALENILTVLNVYLALPSHNIVMVNADQDLITRNLESEINFLKQRLTQEVVQVKDQLIAAQQLVIEGNRLLASQNALMRSIVEVSPAQKLQDEEGLVGNIIKVKPITTNVGIVLDLPNVVRWIKKKLFMSCTLD